jgi:hypothetical protein
LCAISRQTAIDQKRGFFDEQYQKLEAKIQRGEPVEHYMYLPTENGLRVATLGNYSLAADYLWLSSLQYVTSPFFRGNKAEILERFYYLILRLDPQWVEVHVKAGGLLYMMAKEIQPTADQRGLFSSLGKDRSVAERFLLQTALANPDDWRPWMELGMLYMLPSLDPEKQAKDAQKSRNYFDMVLTNKSLAEDNPARKIVQDLWAKLGTEIGHYTAAAEYLWRSTRDEALPKELREANAREWLFAESMVRVETVAEEIAKEKKKNGVFPQRLADLYAGKTPLDAYGFPLGYNPETGKIWALGVQARRALQIRGVLHTLIHVFSQAKGRPPQSIQELNEALQSWYSNRSKAGPVILETFGSDLNCENNPFDEPWPYDPTSGKVVLPEEYEPQALNRNSALVLQEKIPPAFREKH